MPPASAGSGCGAPGWSSQYDRAAAPASDLATGIATAARPALRSTGRPRDIGVLITPDFRIARLVMQIFP